MKRLGQAGFTLVELVIIMPIVSVTLLALTSFMVQQYAELHTETAKANLQLEAETMLLDLEDELLFTTDFANTKSSDLTDSYAPSGGWTYNTTPETLIVYETSLTAQRRDPNREFVYKNQYGCSGGYAAYNPIAINNLMYFTTQNSTDSYRTLYRRTLVPSYSTCNTNYKKQTCPAANVGSGGCTTADSKLTDKLKDLQIDYYDDNNVATSNPLDAEKIKISVELAEKKFGKEISVHSSITMKKIN